MLFSNSLAYGWNATGHREVVAVAWSALDPATRNRVAMLLASQHEIPDTEGLSGEAAWMEAAVWPDELRDQSERSEVPPAPPTTTRQWLAAARSGEASRHWHFADRDIAKPFNRQTPRGLLEPALAAQTRLLGDVNLPLRDRAIALAWVSHLVADAHQPLHCASRADPNDPGQLDAGGNSISVLDAGRKPPEPVSLHRWWDNLPGHMKPDSKRFASALIELLFQSLTIDGQAISQPPRVWLEESFAIARDQIYPSLQADPSDPGVFMIRQDDWLRSREMMQMRLALAGRRLAYVVTQALKTPPR